MEAGGSVEMAKRIVELEVECSRLKDKRVELEMEVELERQKKKDKCAKLKETINSKDRKWKEENDKVWEKYTNLEVQKRKLEIDLKASICKRESGDDMVRKLKMTEAVVVSLTNSMTEKDDQIKDLLKKYEDLEKGYRISNVVEPENRLREVQVEKRLREVEGMIPDLHKRINVCEKEKKVMQDRVSMLRKMNLEIKSLLFEKMEREWEVFGRVKSLEEENGEMKAKIMEMNAEIANQKIAAQAEKMDLEEEKRKMEAKAMEMNAENDREKIAAQAEKIAFEEKKRELEAKILKMKAEIAKEKMAFKEKEKKMEAMLTRLNRLLKEKEEEMCNAVEFLWKDNETLEAQLKMVKSELHMKKAILEIKREKDEECSRHTK